MARPVWTGSISFGLVNVPVKAFTAVRDHDVHFHQLDKKSGSRIRNHKVSEKSGKRGRHRRHRDGLRGRKGRYVTFDKDELNELRPASTRAIDVTDFVALDDDRPDLLRAHLLARPRRRRGKKAYQLLLAAMEDRAAGGDRHRRHAQQAVPRRHPSARRRAGHVDDALRRRGRAPRPRSTASRRRAKPDAKELKLATQIIDSLAADGSRSSTTTPTPKSCASASRRKDEGKEVVEEDRSAEPRPRCST